MKLHIKEEKMQANLGTVVQRVNVNSIGNCTLLTIRYTKKGNEERAAVCYFLTLFYLLISIRNCVICSNIPDKIPNRAIARFDYDYDKFLKYIYDDVDHDDIDN